MMPFFSIIIPLYNKEDFIGNTLKSVLNQSFSDFEVIIIDDGSTDSSLEKVKVIKDDRVSIFSIKNQGVSHARNFGIPKATTNYIALLDADDYWDTNYLETIKSLIDKYPEENVFATAVNILTNKEKYTVNYKGLLSTDDFKVNFFKGSQDYNILTSSSAVIHKTVFNTIGLFDEDLPTGEDTDFWIRLGLAYSVVFSKKELVTIFESNNSLTESNKKKYKSIDYEKYLCHTKKDDYLARLLNRNIYSSALKNKLLSNNKDYLSLKSKLDFKKLSFKQKVLIQLPRFMTKIIILIYNKLSSRKKYY